MTLEHGEVRTTVWKHLVRMEQPIEVSEAAFLFGIDAKTVSRALHRMAERNEVESLPHPSDKRKALYRVTGTCRVPYGVCLAETQA